VSNAKSLVVLGFVHVYTTMLYRDYNEPNIRIPSLTNQDSMENKAGFCCWFQWKITTEGFRVFEAHQTIYDIWMFPKIVVPPNHPFQ